MAKFSIITPEHDKTLSYLHDLKDSILAQTFQDWEWIVVCNSGATFKHEDPRIKVSHYFGPNLIGAIKNDAFMKGEGDYLVEADHDDILTPNCLEELAKAIDANNQPDFVYSNDVYFSQKGQTISAPAPFQNVGVYYRPFVWKGVKLNEYLAHPLTPFNLAHIWNAPDHVRVFKRTKYQEIGGHDKGLKILDDLDIMNRMYLNGTWLHVDKPLYLYRLGDNTWEKTVKKNEKGEVIEVRGNLDGEIRRRHMEKTILHWTTKNNYQIVDTLEGVEAAADNSIGYCKLFEKLHKVSNKQEWTDLIYKKMAPGGTLWIQVIHGACDGYIADPSSKTPWVLKSFDFWTKRDLAKTVNSKVRYRQYNSMGYEWNIWKQDWGKAPEPDPTLKFIDWCGVALKGGPEETQNGGHPEI